MIIVQTGDRVKYWSPRTGRKPNLGTVVTAESHNGSIYATIRPDVGVSLIYLYYGAIEGFAPIDEFIDSWGPQAMARLRWPQ